MNEIYLQVNDLLLIMDEGMPSTYWHLGRVQEVVVVLMIRSAKLLTKAEIVSRGVVNLAKLPIDECDSCDHHPPSIEKRHQE